MNNSTISLVELRHHYATVIAQFQRRAIQAKTKIEHIDALLVDELRRGRAVLPTFTHPERLEGLTSLESSAALPSAPIDPTHFEPTHSLQARKAVPAAVSAQRQKSFTLRPEYQDMTKLEAITKALTAQPGQVLHQDSIIKLLYGELSSEQLSLESRRMRASLFQGLQKGLWQRAAEPSSYTATVKDSSQSLQANLGDSASAASQSFPGQSSVTLSRAKFLPKLIKLKPGKPPSARTRKKSSKLMADQPERKQLEIVALLRKPSFSL